MKIRFLSLVMIISLICPWLEPGFSFAASKDTYLRSNIYTITYNNSLYENMNTISDIPANTAVNTFLYNMRRDNPDYIIDIFNASGTVPSSFGKISDYTTRRMYVTARKENTDEGERFVLLPLVSSSFTEDFENYATGIFVSDSSWTYLRTRDNIGMAYIVCDSDSNRFFRNVVPAAGDSDYIINSDGDISTLTSAHLCVPDEEVTKIYFKIRNHDSKAYVQFRDSGTTAEGHTFRPVYNLGTNLTCFYSQNYAKDSNADRLTFNPDEWISFRIEVDRKDTKKINVYLDGDNTLVASLPLSNYPDFNWNDFRITFGTTPTDKNNLRAYCDMDEFRFGTADNSFVKEANIYTQDTKSGYEYSGMIFGGDNKIKLTVDTSKLTSASKLYAAEKVNGELAGISVYDIPGNLSGIDYLPVELNVKSAAESSVELYIWENDSLIPLMPVVSPKVSDISKAISNGHPRVMANAGIFEQIVSEGNEALKHKVISYADEICDSFTATDSKNEFYIGDGDSFSNVANKVKKYGVSLGMAYQLTLDIKYAQKLCDILLAASLHIGWTDGSVNNLTVAYMTEGFSLGFDWCYDGLTPEQRQTIADIAMEKCISFAKNEYENNDRGSHTWSTTYTNHNPIPTSSFITASISFAEYNPQLCQMILDYSCQRLKIFLAGLFPDGGWWEGSMYTNLLYAHMAKASETLRVNFGTDNVIASNYFIKKSPDFFMALMGPGGTHNLAEEKTVVTTAIPEMLWLANINSRADVYAWAVPKVNYDNSMNCAMALIWNNKDLSKGEYAFKNNYTRGIEHITLGSGSEENDLWLSVLGGVNMGSHKHMDLGSFIFDYDGVRWATEFGCEDYYKGYHAETSANKIFYRSRAEGHNTLEINPTSASGGQRMNDENGVSNAEVIRYNLRASEPYAVYDMSTAYSDNASYVKRGFRLLEDNNGVIIRDEFSTSGDSDIINWYMHTDAVITLNDDSKSALLTQDEKTLKLTVLEDDLVISITDAMTPEPILTELLAISKSKNLELSKQKKNIGKQKIQITRTGTGEGTITVVLSDTETEITVDASLSLDDWR